MEFKVKKCYLCGLPYAKADRWNPDAMGETERLHCSLQCNRMYRIAYASDPTLRIEHAIKRAQDALAEGAEGLRAVELRLRITSLKRSLKIKKARAAEARALKSTSSQAS